MGAPRCSQEEFIDLFEQFTPEVVAEKLGTKVRQVYKRRKSIEDRLGTRLIGPGPNNTRAPVERRERIEVSVPDGTVLIGSDVHIWPGVETTAMRGFVKLCKQLQPKVVILNGDVMDFPSVSRHNPLGWEHRPEVADELRAAQEWTNLVVNAAPNAKHIWTAGNHDMRFEGRISDRIPELAGVTGVHLKDHFPYWQPSWSVWLNDEVVVKHNWKGGIHAVWNNVVQSGMSMVTSHLHNPYVRPYTDYRGTRYGTDTGTLAEPYGPQFAYLQDSPRNWRSAFCALRFIDGRLLQPQIALTVDEGKVDFCNEIMEV